MKTKQYKYMIDAWDYPYSKYEGKDHTCVPTNWFFIAMTVAMFLSLKYDAVDISIRR